MNINSSSTSTQTVPPSSTIPLSQEEAYIKQFIPQSKPATVGQIRAEGEVKTKIGIIWFVGVICVLLIIIGGISLIKNPETAKDVWVIIGPILSSTITGIIAFLTGEKQNSGK